MSFAHEFDYYEEISEAVMCGIIVTLFQSCFDFEKNCQTSTFFRLVLGFLSFRMQLLSNCSSIFDMFSLHLRILKLVYQYSPLSLSH